MNKKRITDKFYKTEEERQALIQKHKQTIGPFVEALRPIIEDLIRSDLQFNVYFIDGNTIHLGLHRCCGNDSKIPPFYREIIEKQVLEKTQFTNIVWEA